MGRYVSRVLFKLWEVEGWLRTEFLPLPPPPYPSINLSPDTTRPYTLHHLDKKLLLPSYLTIKQNCYIALSPSRLFIRDFYHHCWYMAFITLWNSLFFLKAKGVGVVIFMWFITLITLLLLEVFFLTFSMILWLLNIFSYFPQFSHEVYGSVLCIVWPELCHEMTTLSLSLSVMRWVLRNSPTSCKNLVVSTPRR